MCAGNGDVAECGATDRADRVGVVLVTNFDATSAVGRPHGLITIDGGGREACCDGRATGAGDAKAGTGTDGRRRGWDGDGVACAIMAGARGVCADAAGATGLSGTTKGRKMPAAPMAGAAAAGDASDANGELLPAMAGVDAAVCNDAQDPRGMPTGVGTSNANDKV
jgi:hypothetical protein